MKYLYYIKIGNMKKQLIIFTSFYTALEYCKSNTIWSSKEILNNIKRIEKVKLKDYYVI